MVSISKNPEEIVKHLRNTFDSGRTRSLDYRIKQLKALGRLLDENRDKIIATLEYDLHKSKTETILTEIDMVAGEIKEALHHLKEWNNPEKPPTGIANILDSVYIVKDPYGVVLVIGAWNYPLQLSVMPAVGAIAAGNCVLIKPSEVASATSRFLAEYVPKYLDSDAYQVLEGGVQETTELLKQRFDYIFYTGSSSVGRIVHAAANKYLTPVTLELGGKSPVYLDKNVDIETATKRILWGKCLNAGQTCVAPDYLLCTEEVQDKFVACAKKVLKQFFGDDPKNSPDLSRIVNERHFTRIVNLLNGSEIAIGGQHDASEKYIAPTIITNAKASDLIMQDEIFGPILPIVKIDGLYDAIDFINKHEKPLALYIFSNNKNDVKQILQNTSAGGVTVNDTIMHLVVPGLPFGGVGNSGMGAYHAKYTYDAFTHKKSVLHKNLGALGETLSSARYPPYTIGKLNYLRMMLKPGPFTSMGCLSNLFFFALGVASVCFFKFWNGSQKR